MAYPSPTLFGREYFLTIFRNNEAVKRTSDNGGRVSSGSSTYYIERGNDWLTVQQDRIEISDLHVTFRTKSGKNRTNTTQEAVVTIDNLSDDTASQIRAEDTIIFSAGYKSVRLFLSAGLDEPVALDRHPIVFAGQVSSVVTTGRPTSVTTIEAKAVQAIGKSVKISKPPIPRETIADVTGYFVNQLAFYGLPTGRVLGNTTDTEFGYASGYSAKGKLWDSFLAFCESVGLRGYVNTGRLYVEPIELSPSVRRLRFGSDGNVITEEVQTITVTTYVQLTNNQIKEITSEIATKDKGKQGVRVKTFFDGEITTDKRLRILEGTHQGDYEISNVNHIFDSRDGEASTIISVRRLES